MSEPTPFSTRRPSFLQPGDTPRDCYARPYKERDRVNQRNEFSPFVRARHPPRGPRSAFRCREPARSGRLIFAAPGGGEHFQGYGPRRASDPRFVSLFDSPFSFLYLRAGPEVYVDAAISTGK